MESVDPQHTINGASLFLHRVQQGSHLVSYFQPLMFYVRTSISVAMFRFVII